MSGGGEPLWLSETERADGLVLQPTDAGYTIVPGTGVSITFCPCCGKTMPTKRVARLVADRTYPIAAGGAS
jgi:hypothetical protein